MKHDGINIFLPKNPYDPKDKRTRKFRSGCFILSRAELNIRKFKLKQYEAYLLYANLALLLDKLLSRYFLIDISMYSDFVLRIFLQKNQLHSAPQRLHKQLVITGSLL